MLNIANNINTKIPILTNRPLNGLYFDPNLTQIESNAFYQFWTCNFILIIRLRSKSANPII